MNLDLNMYVHLTSRLKGIKAEAIRKLSNQSQNNFKRIASLFTLFKGYKCSRGSEWGGPFVGCQLKFSYFVGSRLKFSIFVGSRLNFLIFVGYPKISVNK